MFAITQFHENSATFKNEGFRNVVNYTLLRVAFATIVKW